MKKILLGLALAIVATSCKGFLDINTDPNYPGEASNKMLLPSAQVATAATVGGDMQLVGALWTQAYTQNNGSNQYNTTVNYTISTSSYTGFWTNTYSRPIADLMIIEKQAEKLGEWNYWLISQVMLAYNYQILTDWYGACPYKEAASGNFTPVYDDSKVVYAGIIGRLDAAVAKAADAQAANLPVIDKSDFLYNGNIAKWVKFAKTLKLKLLMRDFATNSDAITALLNEGDLLVADAGFIKLFVDKENNSNPLYENDRRKLNTTRNLSACITAMEYLRHYNDPRMEVYYELNNTGVFRGFQAGDRPATGDVPSNAVSRAVLTPTDNVYFLSEVESYFLQAEAWARLNNSAKAKEFYDKGVKSAYYRWDTGPMGNNFVAISEQKLATGGAYEFKVGSIDQMVEQVMTQKWIASIRAQSMEAFFDINRTGYPTTNGSLIPGDADYVWGSLTPVIGTTLQPGEYPKRMLFPKTSIDNNPNAPTVLPITTKLWWQK